MDTSNLVLMRMPLGPLGTNCYVIGDKEQGEAFIIDPATTEVLDALKKHNLKPKAVLLTHGHGHSRAEDGATVYGPRGVHATLSAQRVPR